MPVLGRKVVDGPDTIGEEINTGLEVVMGIGAWVENDAAHRRFSLSTYLGLEP